MAITKPKQRTPMKSAASGRKQMRTVDGRMSAARRRSGRPPHRKPVALVWDDHQSFRKQMVKVVRAAGFRVISHDEPSSLRRTVGQRKEEPDVAIVDWVDQRRGDATAGSGMLTWLSAEHPRCFTMVYTGDHAQLVSRKAYEHDAKSAGADMVMIKGNLGILRDPAHFTHILWRGAVSKHTRTLVAGDATLDPIEVYVEWLTLHDTTRSALSPDNIPRECFPTRLEARTDDEASQMDALYSQLRAIVSAPSTPANEARLADTLSSLRALQQREAHRMNEFFERHRLLPQRVAEDFLREHNGGNDEHPSS